MKVQAHNSLEPSLEYNQDQMPLMNQDSLWPFQPSWELQKYYEVSGKMGKQIPKSSRSEFLEKFLAKNFALSDAEDNTSEHLNRGGIADLVLLKTLLAIHQKYKFLGSHGVFCSFSTCKFGSLKNPLQWLLACLNFPLDSEDLFCWYKG